MQSRPEPSASNAWQQAARPRHPTRLLTEIRRNARLRQVSPNDTVAPLPQMEHTEPAPNSIVHVISGIATADDVNRFVSELQASRREEPGQIALALEAHGGGVARAVACLDGSSTSVDLPASTFEAVGTGTRRLNSQSRQASRVDSEVSPAETPDPAGRVSSSEERVTHEPLSTAGEQQLSPENLS